MIIDGALPDPPELLRRIGWELRPEGACRGDRCVPLPVGARDPRQVLISLGLPLLQDAATGIWCVGPESGGRTIATATVPEIVLPDRRGDPFTLTSLLGRKVLLVAWASW